MGEGGLNKLGLGSPIPRLVCHLLIGHPVVELISRVTTRMPVL